MLGVMLMELRSELRGEEAAGETWPELIAAE
jgi:hypothetical protein